jgi:hypothetical protein
MSLHERVIALEAAVLALGRLEFGDYDGHPFRGNQYTEGSGEANLSGRLHAQGGFTVDAITRKAFTSGLVVAYPERSAVHDAAKFFSADRAGRREIVKDFIRANAELFESGHAHIGGWHDKEHGKVVFDPVEVFPPSEREAAISAGRERDQVAIYDLDSKKEIPTGGTGGYVEEAA